MTTDHNLQTPGGSLHCWNCNRSIPGGYVMYRSGAPFCSPRCYMNYREWLQALGGTE